MGEEVTMAWIEEMLERARKNRCIICPHCGYEHDVSEHWEVMGRLVNYHSGDGAGEFTCQSCDKDFFVMEYVERTYESKKTIKEFEL